MKEIVSETEAQPLRSEVSWEYPDDSTSNTWDAMMIRGCLCDSSWAVGLDSGETQVSEWHGPDCSLRRCPSGDGKFSLPNICIQLISIAVSFNTNLNKIFTTLFLLFRPVDYSR